MKQIRKNKLKTLALLLLGIPVGLLLLLAFGELVGGAIAGLQHIIQALPIIFLAIFAWKKPNGGGKLLISISIIIFVAYLIFPPVQFKFIYRIINGLLLFSPLLISGILFFLAAKKFDKTTYSQ